MLNAAVNFAYFRGSLSMQTVNWSRFAYAQYATNTDYLCNSVMIFEALHRLQSKAHRLLMYPSNYSIDELDPTRESWLLRRARDEYSVELVPIEVQRRDSGDSAWAESYTKLLIFNQTHYDRILGLDSDATILQHLDDLFLMPPSPVAMPRAYWLDQDKLFLTSLLLLVEPSKSEFDRIDYDMDILNRLYRDSALVLPHRPNALLTGEFRSKSHSRYLGNPVEDWDPAKILAEAKLVHFSDWPVPKPWIAADPEMIREHQPICDSNPTTGQDDCRSRDIWLELYRDFADRRKEVVNKTHKDSFGIGKSRLLTTATSWALGRYKYI
ncbi:nucleotide-diphospho-sugar transferase [Aspergillus keveii]|uniref:Nucleotide-diphospho-sugar transferase n=1 Tax=Aspergillus keveii TaxID=714993 RepID=A0ABR4FN54_9EURO